MDLTGRTFPAASCHSLAVDFTIFEQNHEWSSKHQVLLSQLLGRKPITVQRHGHHYGRFFSSLGDVGCYRDKFEAGLRLGTRMRIVQACAEVTGMGSTLGLILAYECRSLRRLPYSEFLELLNYCRGRGRLYNPSSVSQTNSTSGGFDFQTVITLCMVRCNFCDSCAKRLHY
jgi:hypothetical protein